MAAINHYGTILHSDFCRKQRMQKYALFRCAHEDINLIGLNRVNYLPHVPIFAVFSCC